MPKYISSFVRFFLFILIILATSISLAKADTNLQVLSFHTDSDMDTPQTCFTLNNDIAPSTALKPLSDYVTVTDSTDTELTDTHITSYRSRLCIEGMQHDAEYKITLLSGLPAANGNSLADDYVANISVAAREPMISFEEAGFLLPAIDSSGIPLTTIRMEEVNLEIIHINDRNLEDIGITTNTSISRNEFNRLKEEEASSIWQGSMRITSPLNQRATTAISLEDTVGTLENGLYAIIATDPNLEDQPYSYNIQYFIVSDTALTAIRSDDGITIIARSINTADPIPNIDIKLIANNNAILAAATTNETGEVFFNSALLNGEGGNSPALIYGYGDSFSALDIRRDALLNYSQSTQPDLDMMLYTERGIYRPGEDIYVTALLRDNKGNAIENLPLLFSLYRPDGLISQNITENDKGLGSYHFTIPTSPSDFPGQWRITARISEDADVIATHYIRMEDFVPPRLRTSMETPEDAILTPDENIDITLKSQYLYGAPAAELNASVTATLSSQNYNAFGRDWNQYSFGDNDEDFSNISLNLGDFTLDANGEAILTLDYNELELPSNAFDTSLPLIMNIHLEVYDIDGRPEMADISIPVRPLSNYIGIATTETENLEGNNVDTEISIALINENAEPESANQLSYNLVKLEYGWNYYRHSNSGRYSYNIINESPISGGKFDIDNTGITDLDFELETGRYRIDVMFPDNSIYASHNFYVGGYYNYGSGDSRAIELELTLDKEKYNIGDTAQISVSGPLTGPAMLIVSAGDILYREDFTLKPEGNIIPLDILEDYPGNVMVTILAWRGAEDVTGPLALRAMGRTQLKIDRADRRLELTINAPEQTLPRQDQEITFNIDNLNQGETAYISLAAVDEAVLDLTNYHSPNPFDYYFDRNARNLGIYDAYEKLIDARDLPLGILRTGGGMAARMEQQAGGLSVRSSRVVAIYHGPIITNPDGTASLTIAMPDFNGELRLMATAWSETQLGSSETAMISRDPIVADLTLPRFLAPDDIANSTLQLRNLEASSGIYNIELTTEGTVTAKINGDTAPHINEGETYRTNVNITADKIGIGHFTLTITGENGFKIERDYQIQIRPASAFETTRSRGIIEPTENIDFAAKIPELHNFAPDTATMSLSASLLPEIDVNSLIRRLDRYPYGCTEQTISTTMPLILFDDMTQMLDLENADNIDERVQNSIRRLAARQTYNGGYGYWSHHNSANLWLSAYVLDFYHRATEAGYHVPEEQIPLALDWIEEEIFRLESREVTYNAVAISYAYYAQSLYGAARLSEVRRFANEYGHKLPTDLARAYIAASFANLGDATLARVWFSDLEGGIRQPIPSRWLDYGSNLRDRAAILTLKLEANIIDRTYLMPEIEQLAYDLDSETYLSTQEMVWSLILAHSLIDGNGDISLDYNGEPATTEHGRFTHSEDITANIISSLTNTGQNALYYALSIDGIPQTPPPATENGFTLERSFFDLEGNPIDPNKITQNETFVVMINGSLENTDRPRESLLIDLLPAGWEPAGIDLPHGWHPITNQNWQGRTAYPEMTSLRDDRYIASFNLMGGNNLFAVAYVLRAVSPGIYTLPGSQIEDMYRPDIMARTAPSHIAVMER